MFRDGLSGDNQRYQNVTASIIGAASRYQFTILGDTDHSSRTIRDFLTSPELLDAAHKGGVKHIFFELPAIFQDEVDQLRRGEITKKEFARAVSGRAFGWFENNSEKIKYFSDMADFIVTAKDRGIAVHFADEMDINEIFDVDDLLKKEFGEDAVKKYYKDLVHIYNAVGIKIPDDALSDMKQMIDLTPEQKQKILEAVNALPQSDRENLFRIYTRAEEMTDEKIAGKRLNDTDVVRYITAIAGSDTSLIVYGAGHDHMRKLLSKAGLSNYAIDIVDPKSKGNPDGNSGKVEPDARANLVVDEVQYQGTPSSAPTVAVMNPKSAFTNPSMLIPQ